MKFIGKVFHLPSYFFLASRKEKFFYKQSFGVDESSQTLKFADKSHLWSSTYDIVDFHIDWINYEFWMWLRCLYSACMLRLWKFLLLEMNFDDLNILNSFEIDLSEK